MVARAFGNEGVAMDVRTSLKSSSFLGARRMFEIEARGSTSLDRLCCYERAP